MISDIIRLLKVVGLEPTRENMVFMHNFLTACPGCTVKEYMKYLETKRNTLHLVVESE